MFKFDRLACDADDTLWHNERLYLNAQEHFVQLLAHYHDPDWIRERLYQTETRNLAHFGYGIKTCALAMLESAIEIPYETTWLHELAEPPALAHLGQLPTLLEKLEKA